MSYKETVAVLWIVYVCLLVPACAQTLTECDQRRLPPFIFNFTMGDELTICPETLPSQDTVVCILGNRPDAGYSIVIDEEGINSSVACIENVTRLINTQDCREGYHAVVIFTNRLHPYPRTEEPSLRIISLDEAQRQINILTGTSAVTQPLVFPTGFIIDDRSNSITITDRAYGGIILSTACQVFENGTIAKSEFTVQVSPNEQCQNPTGKSIQQNRGTAVRLILFKPLNIEEGTYTLFLTNESFCGMNASRITQNFNLTVMVLTPPNTTTSLAPETLPQNLLVGVIIGSICAAAAAAAAAVLVIILILAVIVRLKRRHILINNDSDHRESSITKAENESTYHTESFEGRYRSESQESEVLELTSSRGIDENDSGVETNPPTPVKKHLITVLSPSDVPCLDEIKQGLLKRFSAHVHLLEGFDDEENQYTFETYLSQLLPKEAFKLLCVLWKGQLPGLKSEVPLYARVVRLVQAPQYSSFGKICLVQLGSTTESHDIPGPVHFLSLPLPGDNSFTAQHCIDQICDKVKPPSIRNFPSPTFDNDGVQPNDTNHPHTEPTRRKPAFPEHVTSELQSDSTSSLKNIVTDVISTEFQGLQKGIEELKNEIKDSRGEIRKDIKTGFATLQSDVENGTKRIIQEVESVATEVQRVAIDDEQRTSDSDSCHDKDS